MVIIPFLKNNLSLSNSLNPLLVAFALIVLDILIFRFGITSLSSQLMQLERVTDEIIFVVQP